jgi:serine/threonine protein phosphatase PrpC
MIASGADEGLDNLRPVVYTNTDWGRWQVIATSVCGTSHEKMGGPCQDTYRWDMLSEGLFVAAIADGAGSASLGEVGAAVASYTAVEAICRRIASCVCGKAILQLPVGKEGWRLLLIETLKTAKSALEAEASTRKVNARNLASTLIVVVGTPELVAVAQVGDGATVGCDQEGNIIPLTLPQRGEYINETTFLISPDALDTAQVIARRAAITHIAAFSDGLQMLALTMSDGAPHEPFFSPLFRFMSSVTDEIDAKAQLEAFLRSSRVRERTDDDLTLLLAARRGTGC